VLTFHRVKQVFKGLWPFCVWDMDTAVMMSILTCWLLIHREYSGEGISLFHLL